MTSTAVITTYNGEKFLYRLLESVFRQTRKIDEVIILDDRSSDNTVKIAREFIDGFGLAESWKIIVNPNNLGYAENYRKGFEIASGEIVFPVDQDDIWEENRAENMLAVMEGNEGIGLLNTDYVEFDGNGEEVFQRSYNSSDYINLAKIKLNRKTRFLKFPGCVTCFRKDFFSEAKKYWFEGWAHDEFLWCLSVLFGKCYYADIVSLFRRVHEKQTSGKLGKDRAKRIAYLEKEVKCAETLLAVAKKNDFGKQVIKIYEKNLTATKLRLSLVRDRKLFCALKLMFLLKQYDCKKSFFAEIFIALKKD